MMPFIEFVAIELIERNPLDVLGLMVTHRLGSSRREHDESNVVVQVRLITLGRNVVNVDVDRWVDDLKPLDTGLFGCFCEGYTSKIRLAVRVTAGLKPTLQLRVEQQQCCGSIVVEDNRRTGEVPWQCRPIERARLKRR